MSSPFFNHFSLRYDFPKIFISAACYFLAHRIAYLFPDSENIIMLIWPAAGVGLAAFLLNPRRLWPALTVAFYFAGITADVLLSGGSLMGGVGTMTMSMVQSITCAWVILYINRDFQKFTRVKEVLALFVGAVIVNAVTACIGAGTSSLVRGTSFLESWQFLYISDGLGILLICPFIVCWISDINYSINVLRSKKIVEEIAFILIWSGISYIIFYLTDKPLSLGFKPYMLIALLVWSSMRFGMRSITLALIILFLIELGSTGIVSFPSPIEGMGAKKFQLLMQHQVFLMFLAFVGYLLSAFYSNLKMTESSLQRSEDLLNQTQRITKVGGWEYDVLNKQMHFSDEIFNIYGINKGINFTSEDGTKYFRPADRPLVLESFTKAAAKGEPYELELQFINARGENLWVRTAGQPVLINGKVVKVNGNLIDITERKLAAEKMESERKIFQNILDLAPVMIAYKSKDDHFINVNSAFAKFIRLSKENIIGKTTFQIFKQFDVALMWRKNDLEVIRTGIPILNQLTFTMGKWMIYSQLPFNDSEGSTNGTVNFIVDVDDRVGAEEAFREGKLQLEMAIKASNTGLWDWDLKTNKVYYSPEWKQQIGYEEWEISDDYSEWQNRLHPDDLENALSIVQKNIENPSLGYENEFRFRHKDGTYHWILAKASVLIDDHGKPIRMLGSHADITGRKKAEEDLKSSNEQLHALSDRLHKIREEERLNVSRELHDDIGQSLTGIKMDISWLEKKVAEFIPDKNLLMERFSGMKELVDESIAKVRQIASDLRPGILDTFGLLPAIEWQLQDLQQRSGIKCTLISDLKELNFDAQTNLEIFRIIQESLTNVVRHSEAGSAQVNIKKQKDKLIFEVIDNGKGITDDVFNKTTSLGLIGMRERASQINGEISIQGTSGKGSVVSLSIACKE